MMMHNKALNRIGHKAASRLAFRSVKGDRVTMACPFCDIDNDGMKKRIFYRDKNWFAILAAPSHNKGHAILAAVRRTCDCPTKPSLHVLNGLSTALSKTIAALKNVYQPKDILLASLRGSEGHFHFHLVPLYEDDERAWRNSKKDKERYKNGHLMEFLGHVEKQGDDRAEAERRKSGLSEEQQRTRIVVSQKSDIEKLRLVSGYYS
jgi:diadenosine tetraphosphate (Ap4A) HIT family hydrolase